jgi:hypothetical protein
MWRSLTTGTGRNFKILRVTNNYLLQTIYTIYKRRERREKYDGESEENRYIGRGCREYK